MRKAGGRKGREPYMIIHTQFMHSYIHKRTHTHTYTFNGPLSVSEWHQLGHMQVCTSLQTDNHARTPPLSFFTGRMPFLPPSQQRQSTEGIIVHTQTENKIELGLLITDEHKWKKRSNGNVFADRSLSVKSESHFCW